MDGKNFAAIRQRLGKTQKQLASQLCVSAKAIQSFEQGWRNVPPNIERQLLFYLFWETSKGKVVTPCWKTKNCLSEWRELCSAWQNKAGHLCWFLNGTYCQGVYRKSWDEKIRLCMECTVFKTNMPAI